MGKRKASPKLPSLQKQRFQNKVSGLLQDCFLEVRTYFEIDQHEQAGAFYFSPDAPSPKVGALPPSWEQVSRNYVRDGWWSSLQQDKFAG